jgi:hypothetical protein
VLDKVPGNPLVSLISATTPTGLYPEFDDSNPSAVGLLAVIYPPNSNVKSDEIKNAITKDPMLQVDNVKGNF